MPLKSLIFFLPFPPTLRAAGGKRRVVCTRARENWKEVGRLVSLLAFSRTPTASVHLTKAERGSCCKFRYPLDPLPHIFWTLERRPWSSGTLLCVISWFHFPSSSPRGGKQHPELRRGGGGEAPAQLFLLIISSRWQSLQRWRTQQEMKMSRGSPLFPPLLIPPNGRGDVFSTSSSLLLPPSPNRTERCQAKSRSSFLLPWFLIPPRPISLLAAVHTLLPLSLQHENISQQASIPSTPERERETDQNRCCALIESPAAPTAARQSRHPCWSVVTLSRATCKPG